MDSATGTDFSVSIPRLELHVGYTKLVAFCFFSCPPLWDSKESLWFVSDVKCVHLFDDLFGTRKPITWLKLIMMSVWCCKDSSIIWAIIRNLRMPSNRLPRRLLYGEPQLGQRLVGRPNCVTVISSSRYSGNATSLNPTLSSAAGDRELWSSTCPNGLENLTTAAEQAASDRLSRIDMLFLKQLQPNLFVLNVAESVLRISVSAVTFVAIADHKTDIPAVWRHCRNRLTTTTKHVFAKNVAWKYYATQRKVFAGAVAAFSNAPQANKPTFFPEQICLSIWCILFLDPEGSLSATTVVLLLVLLLGVVTRFW